MLAVILVVLASLVLIGGFIAVMSQLEKRRKVNVIVYLIGGVLITLLIGRIMGCEPLLVRTIEQKTDTYYDVEFTEGNVTEDLDVKSAPNGDNIGKLNAGERIFLTGRAYSISYDMQDSTWVEIKLKNGQSKGWIEMEKADLY